MLPGAISFMIERLNQSRACTRTKAKLKRRLLSFQPRSITLARRGLGRAHVVQRTRHATPRTTRTHVASRCVSINHTIWHTFETLFLFGLLSPPT